MGGGRTWMFDCMYQLYLTVSYYHLIILLKRFFYYIAPWIIIIIVNLTQFSRPL